VTKGRSPSTLRRLLGEAERQLVQATEARDRLTQDLATAGSDHHRLTELSDALASAQQRLDEAEERWLALADEAEAQGLRVT
jgi:hypothetical protein